MQLRFHREIAPPARFVLAMCRHRAATGINGRVAVRKGADQPRSPTDFADNPLQRIIRFDVLPVIAWGLELDDDRADLVVPNVRLARRVSF